MGCKIERKGRLESLGSSMPRKKSNSSWPWVLAAVRRGLGAGGSEGREGREGLDMVASV